MPIHDWTRVGANRFHLAYVEPVAVDDILPDHPIFLTPEYYVNCPLEATYAAAWRVFPAVLKAPLEQPGATAMSGHASGNWSLGSRHRCRRRTA
jgi:hypothetical protein